MLTKRNVLIFGLGSLTGALVMFVYMDIKTNKEFDNQADEFLAASAQQQANHNEEIFRRRSLATELAEEIEELKTKIINSDISDWYDDLNVKKEYKGIIQPYEGYKKIPLADLKKMTEESISDTIPNAVVNIEEIEECFEESIKKTAEEIDDMLDMAEEKEKEEVKNDISKDYDNTETGIVLMTEQEMASTSHEHQFDSTVLYYHTEDGILTNERYELVDENYIYALVGDTLDHIDDRDILNIRNFDLDLDIEVLIHRGSYPHSVTGYSE